MFIVYEFLSFGSYVHTHYSMSVTIVISLGVLSVSGAARTPSNAAAVLFSPRDRAEPTAVHPMEFGAEISGRVCPAKLENISV